MKKYWIVFKLTLGEYFIYRLNFILWRFRSIVSFLVLFFFWDVVYANNQQIFGYGKMQMLTYLVGMSVLRGIILSSKTAALAGMVKSGDVVNKFLNRPWKVINVCFFQDLAAKFLNTIFVFLELLVLIKLLNLPFFVQQNGLVLLIFLISCLLSLLIFFFISFSLSAVAFWIDNIWAPRWLFGVIFLEFMSGAFFPLDILPQMWQKIINLTPFPYLIFFPIKIYLGQIDLASSFRILGLMFFWLIFMLYLTKRLWRRGLKVYSAYGG